ncbi:NAD(+) diphosphatase [Kutzneria sp. NPDC052558]|uniref:NAD(+) diphosphatase n=1 Tax=Kutzneria sp. NPDC052558 TaxID=3364121 RepID=UPI0037C9F7CD
MIPYSGLRLDRAGDRRSDPDWIAGLRARPGARVLPFWQDRYAPDSEPVGDEVLLGVAEGEGVFAVELAEEPESTVDVRSLFDDVSAQESATLVYAKALLHWNRNQRFCGTCGGATRPRHGGTVRDCLGCGRELFPRIEPAVIVLVEHEGRALFGRHARSGRFSTLAGFVELGESLEDAVRREVAEEAGVAVGEVRYVGSQPWPFPAGLMVAFRAWALSDVIDVDGDELTEAVWLTPEQVRAHHLPRFRDSIGAHLIETWLAAPRDL